MTFKITYTCDFFWEPSIKPMSGKNFFVGQIFIMNTN